jgi:ABC-type dipeptide/oligopeptide/nickel transport system ATPase subunit
MRRVSLDPELIVALSARILGGQRQRISIRGARSPSSQRAPNLR